MLSLLSRVAVAATKYGEEFFLSSPIDKQIAFELFNPNTLAVEVVIVYVIEPSLISNGRTLLVVPVEFYAGKDAAIGFDAIAVRFAEARDEIKRTLKEIAETPPVLGRKARLVNLEGGALGRAVNSQ